MLETLFKQGAARLRHLNAPLSAEREQYLVHLQQQGTSLNRIRIVAGMLLNIVHYLELKDFYAIDRCAIETASGRWVVATVDRRRANIGGVSAAFTATAIGWFRFHNVLAIEPPPIPPYGNLLSEYLIFLAGPKAMTPATVNSYKSRVSLFLRWAVRRRGLFSEIIYNDVEDYIATLRQADMKPRSIASACLTLRSLFKFTESKGWTSTLISASIVSPSTPRYDPEPKGPCWPDVTRMLHAKTKNTPTELRANAVLFLFAMYGLRSIEVSSLCLEDFAWDVGVLTIKRAKSGRTQRFPIHYDVGHAIHEYLSKGRPKCDCNHLFVTINPPFRPTSHASLRCIVAGRMKRLNIKAALHSTHALRHSCATQMLHKGVSMEEIARFLGHQNNKSVGIYAKCSKASIRAVAQFSLAGLQ